MCGSQQWNRLTAAVFTAHKNCMETKIVLGEIYTVLAPFRNLLMLFDVVLDFNNG